ncbi:MAG: NADPH-dependent FMN reductase [Pseudomonadota bacterium]
MNENAPIVLGIGGAIRPGSMTEIVLRAALARVAARGVRTRLIAGPDLEMPAYDPSRAGRAPKADRFVRALQEADGIVLASPAYHGSVSGLLKNAIDYAEDLREDRRPYFSGRPVGHIVCADGVQALGSTLATLRSVTHALRGWPTPFALLVRGSERPFDSEGRCVDAKIDAGLEVMAEDIVGFVDRMRAPVSGPVSGPASMRVPEAVAESLPAQLVAPDAPSS